MTPPAPARVTVRSASIRDTVRFVGGVLAPVVARGVIVRRPRLLNLLGRLDVDRRAVALMRDLRERYGPRPLRLRIPARSVAVVLDPADVVRVLDGAPDPFHPANREKRAALKHFQPDGVLISTGPARARRRAFTEAVLETPRPVHGLAEDIGAVLRAELGPLPPLLTWDEFAPAWWRAVRRITLGERAADDVWVTDTLRTLRRAANWAGAHPVRRRLRARLLRRLSEYVARAEAGSLAAVARAHETAGDGAEHQIAHWLFAFDAAGMTVFRTLAMLATHPDTAGHARADTGGELPYLRACVLETLRLWPTTPVILRDTTEPTDWAGETLPAGTAMLVIAPYLHRTAGPDADAYRPERWLTGADEAGVVPFSAGPAECPGRNLVLLTTSVAVATMLAAGPRRLVGPARLAGAGRPLPGTLSPFALRFSR